MELFQSFAISLVANNIPTIKDAVSFFGKNTTLDKELERCYQKALKKWCKNDGIRKSMSMRLFRSLGELKDYLQREEHIEERELIDLWADELRNNQICYEFIIEQKMDAVFDEFHNNNAILQRLDEKTNEILSKISQPEIVKPKKGLTKHKRVDGYIRRYCTDEQDGNDYFRYLLKNQDRYTLADYVTSEVIKGKNKFIVYSGAQTGKTTELRNLCWELQQSGLFAPVSYEVKSSYDIKQDEIPTERWLEGREVVVVIDALDEINGKEREDLLKTINSYAHDNPDIKMVLSCRSNYRREDQLGAFYELYIESMSYEDIKVHINHEIGGNNTLWPMIVEQGLADIAKQPFFLNVLIDSYRENKSLPKDRSGIYKLFIEKSYKQEKKKKGTLSAYSANSEEVMAMLERVAVAMSLMNRQMLTETEFTMCLDGEQQKTAECKRYPVIKINPDDDTYSFEHNAFREWLTANYLYKKGLEKTKQLSSLPNGRIKPEWYNIIMLWMGMYGLDETDKIKENIEWMKLACMDLIIYADSSSLDPKSRDQIFISILQEYKNLGIRMSNILSDDYKDMLQFGQSETTVDFIAEELKNAPNGSAYYADLMCMCYFLNWTILEKSSEKVFNKLLSVLDDITRRNLKEKPTGDLQYLYLGNQFFYKETYVKRYFEIFKNSENYDAIKVMISLIHRTGMVDDYVDYILDKEHYVCDQHKGNTTHVVSRDEIYAALATTERADGIEKILNHEFKNYLYYYDSEWSRYKDMIESLLRNAARQIKKGGTQTFLTAVESSYLRTFPDLYHHTHEHQDVLMVYREFYKNTGIVANEKALYEKESRALLGDFDSKDDIKKLVLKTGLWITKEDIDTYYSDLDPNNGEDRGWAYNFNRSPYLEMASYAQQKYKDFFPEAVYEKKSRLRQKSHFDSVADYDIFKQQVLDLLDRSETETRDGLKKVLKADEENPWNSYVYQFYSNYMYRDGTFSRDDIVRAIKDKKVYDTFFMMVVRNTMHMTFQLGLVDESAKKRMSETAKSIVEDMGKGYRCEWEFEEIALKLMLEGWFTVDEDTLIELISVSEVSVSRDCGRGFNEGYTLFEYIEEKVEPCRLGQRIVVLLRDMERWKDSSTGVRMAEYVIKHRLSEGYQTVFEYITNGCRGDEYLAEEMLKARIMVDEIKAATDKMAVTLQLVVCNSICRELGDERWVKGKLEPRIESYEEYEQKQALRILFSIGSVDALAYIVEHYELLDDYRDYNFNYSDVNAATLLAQVLDICHQNRYNNDFTNTSIISSLEKIAVVNEESLHEVKRVIRGLISKDGFYKYLNRYLIQFENKYYESHSPMISIEQVIDMMNQAFMEGTKDNKDEEVKPVYISYSWEKNSDNIVNHFCCVLDHYGIDYKRDKKDCHYTDNIKDFMDSIGNGDIIVVVFSRQYMLSRNCMYELSKINQQENWKDKILPVVVDDSIRDRSFYIELVKHWKSEKNTLEKNIEELKEIDENCAAPIEEELREANDIFNFLPELKRYVDWVNAESLNNLSSTNFKVLIDKIKGIK